MTGQREAELLSVTNLLLDARRTAKPFADLPAETQPVSLNECFWVQNQLIQSFGPVGGWKVGAKAPDGTLLAGPLPRAWIAPSAPTLSAPTFRLRGVEAEVAFLLGQDLPPRTEPYTPAEIKESIASCHPAIELIESGLTDPLAANPLSMIADLQMHGGFIYGPAFSGWRDLDFSQESVALAVDGSVRVEHTASKTPSDFFLNLVVWLANEGAARTGGLHGGQFITTGSWTGLTLATTGSTVDVQFSNLGRVSLSYS